MKRYLLIIPFLITIFILAGVFIVKGILIRSELAKIDWLYSLKSNCSICILKEGNIRKLVVPVYEDGEITRFDDFDFYGLSNKDDSSYVLEFKEGDDYLMFHLVGYDEENEKPLIWSEGEYWFIDTDDSTEPKVFGPFSSINDMYAVSDTIKEFRGGWMYTDDPPGESVVYWYGIKGDKKYDESLIRLY